METQESLVNLIDTLIIDNDTRQVTPSKVRQVLKAIVSSLAVSNPSAITATSPLFIDEFTSVFSINESLLARKVVYITDGAIHELTQEEDTKYLITEEAFNFSLLAGFAPNTLFVIRNNSGSDRQIVAGTDVVILNNEPIPDGSLCFLKKIAGPLSEESEDDYIWALNIIKSTIKWGELIGDIEDQADLMAKFDEKADVTYVNSLVVGLWDDRGNHDASVTKYPTTGGSGASGAIKKGDIYKINVAGNGLSIGWTVRALIDTPAQTDANWAIDKTDYGYVPENENNKTNTVAGNEASTTKYLSVKGVYDYIVGLTWLTALGFGNFVAGLDGKPSPVDDDTFPYANSEDANSTVLIKYTDLKASINTFVEVIPLYDENTTIPAKTYTLEFYAEYPYVINRLKIKSASGTCTAAVKINGTNVTGISAVSVSSTTATATATADNVVAIGDTVTLVITSPTTLDILTAGLKITRTT